MGTSGAIFNRIAGAFGYKVVKTRRQTAGVLCPIFPRPGDEVIQRARRNFSVDFDLSADCAASSQEIREKIDSFFWHYSFRIKPDINIDASYPSPEDVNARHRGRYNHIFPAVLSLAGGTLENKTILDCACNCGYWSIQAIRNGARSVTGFDAGPQNIAQADFLKRLIGLQSAEYRTLDILAMDRATLGGFDISFFLGILYHLNKPVEALARLKEVTNGFAVIDTNLATSENSVLVLRADEVHDQNYSNNIAMYPSINAVYMMLKHVGFKKVWFLENCNDDLPQIYLTGHRGTFLAEV